MTTTTEPRTLAKRRLTSARMWWTIADVAEHTGMTVQQVYETRRRKEWPGNVGVRAGRSLRFDSERILGGSPAGPQHTDDAATAAVWLLEDIRNLVGQIHGAVQDIRRWQAEDRPRWPQVDGMMDMTTDDVERADDE